jgi:hypothetical protein
MQIPTVGRTVHFYHEYSEKHPFPLAAMITGTYQGTFEVALTVFYPGDGTESFLQVPWSEEPKSGHWSWPPRSE